MKARLNKYVKKTVWYENYAPVKEYLDKAFSGKADPREKDPQTTKLSWSEIIKKTFPNK